MTSNWRGLSDAIRCSISPISAPRMGEDENSSTPAIEAVGFAGASQDQTKAAEPVPAWKDRRPRHDIAIVGITVIGLAGLVEVARGE